MKMTRLLPLLVLLLFSPGLWATDSHADDIRHLLSRTGFAVLPGDLARYQSRPYHSVVADLLDGTRLEPLTPPPGWVDDPPPDFRVLRSATETEKKAFRKARRQRAQALKGWWYTEMLNTPSQFTEFMTLFWHNHFTSSIRKVKWPTLMYRQNRLLRRHALGDFRAFLHAIARDPAMVLYLDNQTNRAGQPNENFARELLELFTLGPGNYTERDIREAARAFTGWKVQRKTGRFRINPRQHDNGIKVFLGQRGNFDGDDIIDILLAQPATAEFITAKLWSAFISTPPARTTLQKLAADFRRDYRIRPLVEAILNHPDFLAPANRGSLIRSPVEFLVGTARLLKLPLRRPRILVRAGRALGQDILAPPNVKGWPGGTTWIDSTTYLLRQQILNRVLRGREMSGRGMRHVSNEAVPAFIHDLSRQQLHRLLLPLPPLEPIAMTNDPVQLVEQLMRDPVYQLK